MYYYWGYGLHILSEIEFPELLPFPFETPDVTISIGKTPETIEGEDVVRRLRVTISPDKYLLKILNIVRFYVSDGNKIVVEPLPDGDNKSIRLFLLSNAMAAIIHQRDMIPLHASAIEYGDGIVLFSGASGAGKSTTVSALSQQGYKIFSDDVCVLRYTKDETKRVEALSSYPMVKLWEDSYEKLELELTDANSRIRPQLPKYSNFFHQEFNTGAKSVKCLFVLTKSKLIDETIVERLNPIAAFSALQGNAYRRIQMNAMKKRPNQFSILAKLTSTIPVFKVTRPEKNNTIKQLTEMLQSYMEAHGK